MVVRVSRNMSQNELDPLKRYELRPAAFGGHTDAIGEDQPAELGPEYKLSALPVSAGRERLKAKPIRWCRRPVLKF